jgi:hypothetical protein
VAGFAGLGIEAALLVGLHLVMRVLLKSVEDVFVASLTSIGADEFRRLRREVLWLERGRWLFPEHPRK